MEKELEQLEQERQRLLTKLKEVVLKITMLRKGLRK
jgi:hypothetical protein